MAVQHKAGCSRFSLVLQELRVHIHPPHTPSEQAMSILNWLIQKNIQYRLLLNVTRTMTNKRWINSTALLPFGEISSFQLNEATGSLRRTTEMLSPPAAQAAEPRPAALATRLQKAM